MQGLSQQVHLGRTFIHGKKLRTLFLQSHLFIIVIVAVKSSKQQAYIAINFKDKTRTSLRRA